MSADGATPGVEMDGGVIDAAAAIAAIPGFDDMISDPSPTQTAASRQLQHPADATRAVNGQFRGKGDRNQPATVVDIKTKAEMAPAPAAEAEAEDEASSPAEEFFELPPEKEGAEPTRIKAEEVFQGYQEAKQLKARIAELERGTPPPEVFDQQLMQLIETQNNAIQQMRLYEQMLAPAEPDLELINEESPRYNPGLYQRQMHMAREKARQVQIIQSQMHEVMSDRDKRQNALAHLQRQRGRAELEKIWPEVVNDAKEAARVRSEVAEHFGRYGVTPEVMASITNPGFYAILKHALADIRRSKTQETAVKVVRSKPKLVRGAARSGNPQQQTYQAGMQRLTQSHSVEDAAAAFAGLLG